MISSARNGTIRCMTTWALPMMLAIMLIGGSGLHSYADKLRGPVQKATQIVLRGTGTPNADPARSGPSVAIIVNDTP